MKRLALLLVAAPALLLSGCVVPSHAVVRAPVVVAAHIHAPGCGHFWGYHSGYPVYFHSNRYTYYDGGTWLELRSPPRVHHQSRYYNQRPPARYTPHRSGHQRPAKVHRPSYRGNQRPHQASPARR